MNEETRDRWPRPRFVFVAGLHRTGTSLIARSLGAHPRISAIAGSGAPEDEGCYLQGAIPHTALDGIPGHYATDERQHLVEGCTFDRLETRDRMLSDWTPWFDRQADWWLEKSPVNLTRMRLYQQLFPMSHFVVVLRHPAIMAEALQKWSHRSVGELTKYGLDAYDRMQTDLDYLHCATVIRYEDLVARPETIRQALFAFLELPDHVSSIAIRNGNADYEAATPIDRQTEARLARLGYGAGGEVHEIAPVVRHPLRNIKERTERLLIS